MDKTKVMRVRIDGSKRERDNAMSIKIDREVLRQVNQFRYLESFISDDDASTAQIKSLLLEPVD